MRAGPDGTQIDVIDGQVGVTNEAGGLTLRNGESATVTMGAPPARTPAVNAINVVQWVLYYPAVLDGADLKLDADAQRLKESMSAYQRGDFRAALDQLPPGPANSDDEQVFRAALFLASGEVPSAKAILESISTNPSPDTRLLQLIHALQTLI